MSELLHLTYIYLTFRVVCISDNFMNQPVTKNVHAGRHWPERLHFAIHLHRCSFYSCSCRFKQRSQFTTPGGGLNASPAALHQLRRLTNRGEECPLSSTEAPVLRFRDEWGWCYDKWIPRRQLPLATSHFLLFCGFHLDDNQQVHTDFVWAYLNYARLNSGSCLALDKNYFPKIIWLLEGGKRKSLPLLAAGMLLLEN